MKFLCRLLSPRRLILLSPSCFCIVSKRVPEKLLNESILLRASKFLFLLAFLYPLGKSLKLKLGFDIGVFPIFNGDDVYECNVSNVDSSFN